MVCSDRWCRQALILLGRSDVIDWNRLLYLAMIQSYDDSPLSVNQVLRDFLRHGSFFLALYDICIFLMREKLA